MPGVDLNSKIAAFSHLKRAEVVTAQHHNAPRRPGLTSARAATDAVAFRFEFATDAFHGRWFHEPRAPSQCIHLQGCISMWGDRSSGPDRRAALNQYRRRASVYDLELLLFEPVRRQALAWLAPRRGDTVIDVGCGTGLSFEALFRTVGGGGRIIGIEQSPQMLDKARQRVQRQRWRNGTLLDAPAEDADIPGKADAVLLHFTHDVLQNEAALDNVVRHLKPGATVVASGLKWAPAWALPVNLFVWPAALRSVSSLAGLDQPWRPMARLLGEPELRSTLGGGVYLARWRVPGGL
jgi:SAM-dependent methyltransferase